MINIPTFEVAGRFRIEAVRPDGSVRELCDWFDNLILNQGLDAMASRGNYFRYCQVGSGAAAPLATDTQLQSRIAGAIQDNNALPGQVNTTDRYVYQNQAYTFPVGAATGNISEIGIGWDLTGTTLFSRALVKDASGNPITITVLADEQLRVYYQFRVYQPTTDFFNGTVGGYTVIGRSANVGVVHSLSGWYLTSEAHDRNFFAPSFNSTLLISSGAIAGITGAPTPVDDTLNQYNVTAAAAYVAGSFARDLTITISPNNSNIGGGIGAISMPMGPTYFQFGFTPKIMKTSVQELKIVLRYTWARRAV